MLVSAIYQHESDTGIHMSLLSWTSLLPPTPSHPSWLQSSDLISLSHTFQMALVVKTCLPLQETQETQVRSLGQENPMEQEMATHSSILGDNPLDRRAWQATVHGVAELDMTEQRLSTHISASQHDFGKRTKAKGFEQNSRRSAKKKKKWRPLWIFGKDLSDLQTLY